VGQGADAPDDPNAQNAGCPLAAVGLSFLHKVAESHLNFEVLQTMLTAGAVSFSIVQHGPTESLHPSGELHGSHNGESFGPTGGFQARLRVWRAQPHPRAPAPQPTPRHHPKASPRR